MPLMRYFCIVGSALLSLLFGLNWCFPPISEPVHVGTNMPVIRISSVEKLPERVDIDTSLPTIVPSPLITPEFAERCSEAEVADLPKAQVPDEKPLSRSVTPVIHDAALITKKLAKRLPLNRLAASPPAPSPNRQSSSGYAERSEAPITRMSLLDIIKDRFGRGFLKLN